MKHEASTGSIRGGDFSGTNRLHLSDVGLLAIASWYSPLSVVASSPEAVHSLWKLSVLALVPWLTGVLVAGLLVRRGLNRRAAVLPTFLAIVFLFEGGRMTQLFGPSIGIAILVVTVLLVGALAARSRYATFFLSIAVAGAVFLALNPVIDLFNSLTDRVASSVKSHPPIETSLDRRPDIFLVITDGYLGWKALEADVLDHDSSLAAELDQRGFEIPNSAWSAYWTTRLSVPSLLEMGFPVDEPFEGKATTRDLYAVIGGSNRVVDILRDSGYETYMIEAGWSGSACGPAIDHCVRSPFLDEAVYIPVFRSLAGDFVFRRFGYAFSRGTLASYDWLRQNAERISTDDRPSFVMAHLMAPHPPFLLGRDCQPNNTFDRAGINFQGGGVSEETRERFFEDQRACVDQILLHVADLVAPDDVVLFVADHGTDRRSQLDESVEWSSEAIVERMNVMAAFRADGCTIGDPIFVPNILRRLLSCLGDTEIPDLEPRMWINPMRELPEATVNQLLEGAR